MENQEKIMEKFIFVCVGGGEGVNYKVCRYPAMLLIS